MIKRWIWCWLLIAVLALSISACSAGSSETKLKLAPVSALPQQMQDAPETVREAYQFALANPEVLSKIPCYCGCGAEGHTSVKDCFVQEVRADGTVVWDEMGLG